MSRVPSTEQVSGVCWFIVWCGVVWCGVVWCGVVCGMRNVVGCGVYSGVSGEGLCEYE